MAGVFSWLNENFNLVQTVGIIGSLLLAAGAARREAKAREVEDLLELVRLHRELWGNISQRKDLERIFRSNADVLEKPADSRGRRILESSFYPFSNWLDDCQIRRVDLLLAEMKADVRGFFSLPLPLAGRKPRQRETGGLLSSSGTSLNRARA